MLEGISKQYNNAGKKYASWVTRAGLIFWALVEVAVPRSLLSIIFHHWLKLVYFVEALLIVGSTAFLRPNVQQFAIAAFGVTVDVLPKPQLDRSRCVADYVRCSEIQG